VESKSNAIVCLNNSALYGKGNIVARVTYLATTESTNLDG